MKTKCTPRFLNNIVKTFLLGLMIFSGFSEKIIAEDGKISLAVLPFDNLNKDPEQDYLSGIITSIIRQDLSRSEGLFLVERNNLEDILNEQKLQYTGVLDEKSIIETGRLVGARFILKGGYVFLGRDLFLNLDLINTESGGIHSFSERGYTENSVHALSEKLILHLIAQEITYQSESGNRSIIAQKQQQNAKVILYSPLINGRIYIDDSFIAYTKGDRTVAQELIVPPGKHIIRTHLGMDFGIIKTPEITFGDWKAEVDLAPGERLILEDKTQHFNSILYDMQKRLRERLTLIPGSGKTEGAVHKVSFPDREGNEVFYELEITLSEDETAAGVGIIKINDNGQMKEFIITAPGGSETEQKIELLKGSLDLDLDCSSSYRWDLDYSIWRSDIYQGLHREEYY